jgi:hypothetical protein
MSQRVMRRPFRDALIWSVATLLAALLSACGAAAPTATIPATANRGAAPNATIPATATGAPPAATVSASPTSIPSTRSVATPATRTPAIVTTAPIAASLGNRVGLRVGQTATFATDGLTLRFTAVSNDSRCPKGPGIACATSGSASITVEAAQGEGSTALFFTIPGLTDDTTRLGNLPSSYLIVNDFAGYRIQLVSLEPQPTFPATPGPKDYVASLLVTKP